MCIGCSTLTFTGCTTVSRVALYTLLQFCSPQTELAGCMNLPLFYFVSLFFYLLPTRIMHPGYPQAKHVRDLASWSSEFVCTDCSCLPY